MELIIKEPKDLKELKLLLQDYENIPNNFSVAVEINIFDKEKKWVFMRRGPGCKDGRFKLEGIGGGVEKYDTNFISALTREIKEEVGELAKIKIKKFLYARTEEVYDLNEKTNKFWIILSYIGILESGELQIKEKTKNLGYERYLINEIDKNELTDCAKSAYDKISSNWEEIDTVLEKFIKNKKRLIYILWKNFKKDV